MPLSPQSFPLTSSPSIPNQVLTQMGISTFFLFLFLFLRISVSTRASIPVGDIAAEIPSPSSQRLDASPFKPGIAVLVGALTTMFSLIILLILYTKHCKRTAAASAAATTSHGFPPSSARKNSGIDRAVVESLPVFRFASLRGQKGGLECAVCLTAFDAAHVLRLLPKCKHAFHVECVDTWLDTHSTCPLCRYRIDPEDILLVDAPKPSPEPDLESAARRVPGRHSSALEKQKTTPSLNLLDTATFRRSIDSLGIERKYITQPESITAVGRKDGMLPTVGSSRKSADRRLEHRIIVSTKSAEPRWSDMQAADLLYLQSEMIISGSTVNNGRSVSEITHVRRFSLSNRTSSRHRERQAGLVSRWRAWISSQSQREGHSHCAITTVGLAAQPA